MASTFPSRTIFLFTRFFSSAGTTVEENETKVPKLIVFHVFFRFEILETNRLLQLDPAIDGVFNGPYPVGIDPVSIFLYNLLVTFFFRP